MEENCYTKDILYSSHIKNALQIAMRYQENYSLRNIDKKSLGSWILLCSVPCYTFPILYSSGSFIGSSLWCYNVLYMYVSRWQWLKELNSVQLFPTARRKSTWITSSISPSPQEMGRKGGAAATGAAANGVTGTLASTRSSSSKQSMNPLHYMHKFCNSFKQDMLKLEIWSQSICFPCS